MNLISMIHNAKPEDNAYQLFPSSTFIPFFSLFVLLSATPHIRLAHPSNRVHPAAWQLQVGLMNGTQQQDAYIIK